MAVSDRKDSRDRMVHIHRENETVMGLCGLMSKTNMPHHKLDFSMWSPQYKLYLSLLGYAVNTIAALRV